MLRERDHGLVRPPRPRVLADRPDVCVARCCLGLTIYTRHRRPDASAGVAKLFEAYLEHAPRERLTWFRTSLLSTWKRVRDTELPALVEEVANASITSSVRHLFAFHLTDSVDAPATFFHYREADETRGAGSGYVQLGLPFDAPAPMLFQLAMEAAHETPMWCGVGGYVGSSHPLDPCTSFSAIYAWSKRYWGLDVQDPERARLHAQTGLPSVNWLNLLGTDLLLRNEHDVTQLRAEAGSRGVDWIDAPHAALVRAGPEPTLGDANMMDDAPMYRNAHRALAPVLLRVPVRLYGRFWEHDASARWANRFLAPEEWSA